MTAVTPQGKVKWSTKLEHINNISDMYLYNDNSLIILGNDIPDNGRGSEDLGTMSISNYTLEGKQIWEKRYKNYITNHNVDINEAGVIVLQLRILKIYITRSPKVREKI